VPFHRIRNTIASSTDIQSTVNGFPSDIANPFRTRKIHRSFLYDCEKNCIHVIIQCEIMSLVSGFNKKYKYYFVKNIGIVYDLILNPNVVINFIDSHSYYV